MIPNHKTIIFAGPSAVGKTYVANLLMQRFPKDFEQAKLYTTRDKRVGESSTDRIFISTKQFCKMMKDNKFIIHESFGGNFYGFTERSLHPNNKHLLVNAWPWLIPRFSQLPHAVIISMQAPRRWENMLTKRMLDRGDTEAVINRRVKLISKDYEDLQKNKALTNLQGKFFVIDSNDTVANEIVPWIVEKLGLETKN